MVAAATVDNFSCKACVRELQRTVSSGKFLSCGANMFSRVSEVLGDKVAALGEANDSVEKREKSQGNERAGRWIGVSARGDPRGTFAQPPALVWSNATGE